MMPARAELNSVASVERLKAWFANATPGHQAQYAAGPALPQGDPAVMLVNQWMREGLVRTHNPRDPRDAGRFLFIVVKLDAQVQPVRHAVIPAERKAMMDLLADYAERGRPCPSLAALARKLGLRSRMQAKYQIERLAADGLIRVENRGVKLPRVVTIVKTGKETGR